MRADPARRSGPDTYVLLTSDNGFHLGQHELDGGKGTPYDSDIRVPLLVVGPEVAAGLAHRVVSNIDLAPTFEELAGLRAPAYRSGTSLVADLRRPGAGPARLHVLRAHLQAPSLGVDPDRRYSGGTIDLIPSYVAVRSQHGLLVRLDLDPGWDGTDIAWEYYDYRDAAYERTNTFADPSHPDDLARLRRRLERFVACRAATRDTPVPPTCRKLTRPAR